MPVDLTENVMSHIITAGAQGFQTHMTDLTGNISFASNLARLQAQQRFGELDTLESRAVSGVLATPIASPTNDVAK